MTKNTQKPLVSIILPVFKSEEYLEDCLKSLSNQTYKNIEIVAVVDYLGDNSLKILRNFKKKDPRIKIHKHIQRYGLASTLNRCITLSKGRFIAFMDPVNVANPARISKQVKFLLANEKIAAVGSQTKLINDKGRRIGSANYPLLNDDIQKELISAKSMKFETALIDRTRLPKDILRFKKGTHYPFVYVDVFMKIIQYKELANLAEELVFKREIIKQDKQLINLKKKFTFFKLLFDSTTNYEYKPSIRSLVSPIIRQ